MEIRRIYFGQEYEGQQAGTAVAGSEATKRTDAPRRVTIMSVICMKHDSTGALANSSKPKLRAKQRARNSQTPRRDATPNPLVRSRRRAPRRGPYVPSEAPGA